MIGEVCILLEVEYQQAGFTAGLASLDLAKQQRSLNS